MELPLNLFDIGNIYEVISLVLIVLNMLLDPYFGMLSLNIKKKKVQRALIITVILFIVILIVRIFDQVIFR